MLRYVQDVSWQTSCPAGSPGEDATPEPVLRTLVTYCLAVGVCASEEIEAAREENPVASYICGNFRPNWQVIHQFRRRNAAGLKEAVARVLQDVVRDAAGDVEGPIDFWKEANQRLFRAILADSMALDL